MRKAIKKYLPYLILWVCVGITLGSTLGQDYHNEGLVAWLIILQILIINPTISPIVWRFVLRRISDVAKAIRDGWIDS